MHVMSNLEAAEHPPRSCFAKALAARPTSARPKRWQFVPYDQLHDGIGPLSQHGPEALGVLLVETSWKPAQRAYHKQKLALIVANLRHFALEQAEAGRAVIVVSSAMSYGETLAALRPRVGRVVCMEPAERELRCSLQAAADMVEQVPHAGWLTTADDFLRMGAPPWRMDNFYRHVRRKTGILMRQGRPLGGRWSYDSDNREPYKPPQGTSQHALPALPALPRFTPDAVTREVGELIEGRYGHHPGRLDLDALPATRDDASTLWSWAQRQCLPHFGPYEDAMTQASTNVFHTRLSMLLNLHRLLPRQVIDDALKLPLDLPSLEGFVRQILGWREFMHHVHVHTDGLRSLREQNYLNARVPLPQAYWQGKSGLHCLDTVVQSVWHEGYSHHITRLMVLANIATLMGVDPRAVTDWFWVAYVDAYDWVMETNGFGMGTYALGPVLTTKPYVCGAAYIHRMSDYCDDCAFDPKRNCPITDMYWAFLDRNTAHLADNRRMQMPYSTLQRKSEPQLAQHHAAAAWVQEELGAGRTLEPAAKPRLMTGAEETVVKRARHN